MSYNGLQYNEKTGINPVTGAAVDIPDALDRSEKKVFIAGGAIAQGDWVALDMTKTGSARVLYCIEAAAVADGNPSVIGVAVKASNGFPAAAEDKITVVVRGYAEGASVANAVNAANLPLVVDNTQAGQAVAIVAGDLATSCGVSLEAAAGNFADVYVYGLGS
jgi:hypothetical protein|tara:strand:- start:451 stop:939 length:489 start_codon:yes stop_codon:yes gene_type:complete